MLPGKTLSSLHEPALHDPRQDDPALHDPRQDEDFDEWEKELEELPVPVPA